MAALSVRSIEAIRPRDRPFKVSIDRGLQLRVAPDGRRTLLVRYTVKGSRDERQYSLPHDYGEGPGQIKLADAPSPRPCASTPSASVAPRTAWPSRPAPEPTTWA